MTTATPEQSTPVRTTPVRTTPERLVPEQPTRVFSGLDLPLPVPVEPGHPVSGSAMPMAHPWMPASPCGPECLTEVRPGVGLALRVLRMTAVVLAVLYGVLMVLVMPVLGARGRAYAVRGWFRLVLRGIGVRMEVQGDQRFGVADRGVLVVSNHLSWLDIVALDAVEPVRMVAKSEIRRWPLLGALARVAGTVFVDRERLTRLPATVDTLSGVLREGAMVGVFPEGTTWCGERSGTFRQAAFQAAIDGGAIVRPVALQYRLADGPTVTPAFVGDMTLVRSLLNTVGARGLVVEIHVLDPLDATTTPSRRTLAATAQQAVEAALAQAA